MTVESLISETVELEAEKVKMNRLKKSLYLRESLKDLRKNSKALRRIFKDLREGLKFQRIVEN